MTVLPINTEDMDDSEEDIGMESVSSDADDKESSEGSERKMDLAG